MKIIKKIIDRCKPLLSKTQRILGLDSYKTIWVGFLKGILIGVIVGFASCGTVDKATTHSCELLENGQKCLPDHSCCK